MKSHWVIKVVATTDVLSPWTSFNMYGTRKAARTSMKSMRYTWGGTYVGGKPLYKVTMHKAVVSSDGTVVIDPKVVY